MPTTAEIFRIFLHLGLTAYGGLAMIEPIRRRVVEHQRWLSQADFLDGVAFCQLLPGATVVQLAIYVGYRLRGAAGAVWAVAGFILPAFILMVGLSQLYLAYGPQLAWAKALSRGLGAVVIALLLQTIWNLGAEIRNSWFNLLIAVLALITIWAKLHYLLVFLGAGFLRIVLESLTGTKFAHDSEVLAALDKPRYSLRITLISMAMFASIVSLRVFDVDLGRLANIFLKIGAISFGGGYVMIPILQWDVVDSLKWLSLSQFMDGLLLSYATPGPLLILAAFVGYMIKGLPGAVVATGAVFLIPVALVILLTPYFQKVKELEFMGPFIQGILAALVGMLVLVTGRMGLATLTDITSFGLCAAAAVALIGFRVNLLGVVAGAAVVSLALFSW